jgi:uncharacterized membrane protein YdjX (TVP38/TMEM64 family)
MNIWVRRALVGGVWVGLIVGFQIYRVSTGLDTTDALQSFSESAATAWWAIAAFIGLYLLRPLLLIPGALLTIVGGMIFGAWLGVPVVLIAANGSALVAFAVGVLFVRPESAIERNEEAASLRARWAERMRTNSFESILLMRLLFLPYDLVSYTAGMLRIRWQPFLAANAIGILPGTVAFVLLGASIDNLSDGVAGINVPALIASGVLFIVSIAISQLVKRRQRKAEAT